MTTVARYTSAAQHALEQDRLWPRVWWLAGHHDRLREEGDTLVASMGRAAILIVNDGGTLRAFHNVCPHRGHPLCAADTGRVKQLICPYHRWRFALDGRCEAIPDEASFSSGARERATLGAVRVAVRAGLVWVCLNQQAPSIDTFLGPVLDWLGGYGLDDWALDSEVTVPLAANWKASTDVHNEAYHLHALHPEAMPLVDDTGAEVDLDGWHARIRVPMGRSSGRLGGDGVHPRLKAFLEAQGVRADDADDTRDAYLEALRRDAKPAWSKLSDSQLVDNHMVYVFPNVQLNLHRDHAMVFRHRPEGPRRCSFDQLNLIRDRKGPLPAPRTTTADDPIIGPVTTADLRTAEALQRGYESGGLASLTLSRQEAIIEHMHRGLDGFFDTATTGPAQPQK
ncbi:MAG TPA: aromatic ring-hydroxylating dioxygenase subunit alpha [Polyangiaceae bacterium]|nr:aromatic ring-hydroxylating dioxygenase subunit alpha [Polyangiaceae bacterium]